MNEIGRYFSENTEYLNLLSTIDELSGTYVNLSDSASKEMENFLRSVPIFTHASALLTDNNSNYILLYTDGPLKGCISFLDHEENDPVPGFRNIKPFLNCVTNYPDLEWYDLTLDYPSREISSSDADEDRMRIAAIKQILSSKGAFDDDYRTHLVKCIIALTPLQDIETIFEYVDSDDMYIQEKAVRFFRYHKYTEATQKLFSVALNGRHNGRIVALMTLKEFGTPESKACLSELRSKLPKGYASYF